MERSNTERVLTHRHNTENNLLSQISNNKKTTRYISNIKNHKSNSNNNS